ncbi:hypothetical protein PIB30_042894 [Stylosanthes scabra]|uniref:Uncharacterized protein n=1 Tax=Stylosanthes scabra TaxID=79078 RepID=A0ABU6SH02_9FABA|nr:hypothetical protein [Stylosanthes scabra]
MEIRAILHHDKTRVSQYQHCNTHTTTSLHPSRREDARKLIIREDQHQRMEEDENSFPPEEYAPLEFQHEAETSKRSTSGESRSSGTTNMPTITSFQLKKIGDEIRAPSLTTTNSQQQEGWD